VRLWCGHCRRQRPHRPNGIGMLICRACGCYRDLPNNAKLTGGLPAKED